MSPSSFCKRYIPSHKTPSPSSLPTLPLRKRYRGISELIVDTESESLESASEREGSKDGVPDMEEEETTIEGQQQAVPVVDTAADGPLGLGYGALRHHELALGEGPVPSTFMVGQSSRTVPDQQMADGTLTPRTPACTTWIDPKGGTIYLDIKVDPRSYVPVQSFSVSDQSISSPIHILLSPGCSPSPSLEPPVIPSLVSTLVSAEPVDESFLAELGAHIKDLRLQLMEERRAQLELTELVTRLERRLDLRE
ncbi:hypothetical protein Tco_1264012 [Tanacetum coccineum]